MALPPKPFCPNGAGSKLTFRLLGRGPDEVRFVVLLETPWVSCSAPATTHVSGPPGALFEDISRNWRGWDGEKQWADIEGRVRLMGDLRFTPVT